MDASHFIDTFLSALEDLQLDIVILGRGDFSPTHANTLFCRIDEIKRDTGYFKFQHAQELASLIATVLDHLQKGQVSRSADLVRALFFGVVFLADRLRLEHQCNEALPEMEEKECLRSLEQCISPKFTSAA